MSEQADRYNEGKAKLSMFLEMAEAVQGVTGVLEYGAVKYSRGNYQKGLHFTEVADSLLRH